MNEEAPIVASVAARSRHQGRPAAAEATGVAAGLLDLVDQPVFIGDSFANIFELNGPAAAGR